MPWFFNFLKNKKLLLSLLAVIFLGAITPIYFANAIAWAGLGAILLGGVGGALVNIGLFGALLFFFYCLCLFALWQGNNILGWALSGPFKIAMTNPNNNVIIQLGWTLTRDFTNMLFILGLAYIGLATALDIANFDTKKAFINLIIIALLINFTPVICGVIVDIANLVTNFFIQDVDFVFMLETVEKATKLWSGLWNTLLGAATFDTQQMAEGTFNALASAAFSFFAGMTLLIFGGLFLLRPIIIWILVILSPLAFFAWIFDKSKKYFQMWWKNFIGWAFVSVPASFFLYLAFAMTKEAEKSALVKATTDNKDALTQLAPAIVITAFMAFGFYATKTLTPMGANMVLGYANKIKGKGLDFAKKFSKKTGKFGFAVGSGMGTGAISGVASGKGWGRVTEGLKGAGLGFTPSSRLAAQRSRGQFFESIGARRKGSTERKIAKDLGYNAIRDDYKNLSTPELEKILNQKFPVTKGASAERAIAMEQLINRGDYGKTGAEAEKDINFMTQTHRGINISDIGKQAPDLQQYLKTKDFAADVRRKAPGAVVGTPAWDSAAQEVNEEWAQRHYKDIETMSPQQRSEAARKIRKESLNHLIMSLKDTELDSMGDWLSANQRKQMRNLVSPGSASLAEFIKQETDLRAAGQTARADRLRDAVDKVTTSLKFTV